MRTSSNETTKGSAPGSSVRRLVIAGFAAAAAMSVGAVTATAQQMLCGEHEDIVQALKLNWQEDRTAIGLSSTGAVMEVYSSAEGTWTLLMTTPEGSTCLISAGEYFETIKVAEVGEGV